MKKTLTLLVILLSGALSLAAQDVVKFGQAQKQADPNIEDTKSIVAFITANDNFRVTPVANIDKVKPTRQTTDGKYITEVVCDLGANSDRARSFKVTIKGTSLGDYTKQVVEPGKRILIDVTNTIEHNLYFEPMNTERGYKKEGGVAGIEFNVPDYIDNPKVDCSEGIGHVVETKGGNGVNIVIFEVNIAKLNAAREKYTVDTTKAVANLNEAQATLKAFNEYEDKHMNDEGYDFDKADIEKKKKEDAVEEATNQLAQLEPPFINLYASKSNVVPLNIDLYIKQEKLTKPKSLLQINVGDGMHTETKFDRSYNQLRAQADREYRQRKYNAAITSYRNAAADPSATDFEKQSCLSLAEQMVEYSQAKQTAYNQIRAINDMKKQGGMVDYNKLEETYNTAIVNFRHLYQDTQDEEYQTMVNKLIKARDAMGQVITGVVYRGGYHQGQGGVAQLTGVKIYGLHYYNPKKMDEGVPAGGDFLGEVDEKGLFHLQLEKGKYTGLLFVPREDIKELKNEKNQYYRIEGTKHMNLKVPFRNTRKDGKNLRNNN